MNQKHKNTYKNSAPLPFRKTEDGIGYFKKSSKKTHAIAIAAFVIFVAGTVWGIYKGFLTYEKTVQGVEAFLSSMFA